MNDHAMTRRDEVASATITAWVVTGLFLDGWAHNVDKPETFFTPWHGVLYSGFVAGGLWSVYERRRARRLGEPVAPMPRLMRAGFALFAVGGVADMVWHLVFGIEQDVEALLSPTHLTLMMGGLLLTTGTVRSALARGDRTPSLRDFAPALVGITLGVGVVGFFLQFGSAFRIEDHAFFDGTATEGERIVGVLSVLWTNALLLGAVAWTRAHFRPPTGTFTAVLGGAALLMTSQHAFDEVLLVVPALVAGVVADVMVGRRHSDRAVLVATPLVLWIGWFAVYHAVWGLGWAAELWTGSICFAVLTGFGLGLLTSPTNSASVPAAGHENEAKNGNGQRTPPRAMAELPV